MPWRAASPMDQRTQFIADFLRDALSITELCALVGISRKTGYQWIDRYLRQGPAGLEEQSRRPRRAPNQTSAEIVDAILDARRRQPTWGGKKLLAQRHTRHPRWTLPGRSTACAILSRQGMVPIKRRRRRIGHPGQPTSPDPRAERRLERRLPGAVSAGRRLLLLSVDGGRRVQPLSPGLPGVGVDGRGRGAAGFHAAVSGVRPAEAPSPRPRRAVRHHDLGALVDALGGVGASRHPPRADRALGRRRTVGMSGCLAR